MKIVKRQETIIYYSIDPYYFENHSDVERSYTTQSNWRRAEAEGFLLNYGISFSAFDKKTGDQFVKYESRLKLECFIDNISIDNFAILKIKEEMHLSAVEFIKRNSLSFFDRLKFPVIEFTEERALREKEAFHEMTKNAVPLEQKSESQKDLEKMIDRNSLAINVNVK